MTEAVLLSSVSPRVSAPDREWMTRKEAAAYLSRMGREISVGTLANMAANNNRKKGPRYTRVRWARTRYRRDDLDEWLKEEMVTVG